MMGQGDVSALGIFFKLSLPLFLLVKSLIFDRVCHTDRVNVLNPKHFKTLKYTDFQRPIVPIEAIILMKFFLNVLVPFNKLLFTLSFQSIFKQNDSKVDLSRNRSVNMEHIKNTINWATAFFNSRSLKIRLLQCYEVVLIHNS